MSITTNTSSGIPLQMETALAVKMAGVAKNNLELQGQMALSLIESTSVPMQTSSSSSGSIGGNVNISV